jgi:hypothetical protein
VLAGLAALLAIAYELVSRRRKRPVSRQAGVQEAEQELAAGRTLEDPKCSRPRDRRNDDLAGVPKERRPLEGQVKDVPRQAKKGRQRNCEGIKDTPPKTRKPRDHF